MAESGFDHERYAKWRATVTFSDEVLAQTAEEIAAEMAATGRTFWHQVWLERAAKIRAGRLSVSVFKAMLPNLIRLCGICGKKALYRWGQEGRCRAHKDQIPQYCVGRTRREDARQADIEAERSRRLAAGDQHRADRRRGKLKAHKS